MRIRRSTSADRTLAEVVDAARLAAADIALITDAAETIVFASESFTAMTGYRQDEILGRHCRFLQGYGTLQSTVDEIRQVLASGEVYEGEILNYRMDGSAFWNAVRILPLRLDGTRVTHFVSVQRDISNRIAMLEQLRTQARHDQLTGLPNRAAAESAVEEAAGYTSTEGMAVGVALIDLDNFRGINNSLGYAAGDAILRQWVIRVQARLDDSDVLARMSGDEFLLIISSIRRAHSEFDLAKVLSRIYEAVQEPFAAAGQLVKLEMSMGLGLVPPGGTDARTILRQADEALQAAKARRGGPGRWWQLAADTPSTRSAVAEPPARAARRTPDPSAAGEDSTTDGRINAYTGSAGPVWNTFQTALHTGKVTVELQPVVDLRTGTVHLFEALARLILPGGRPAYPGEFLPYLSDADHEVLFAQVLDQGLRFLVDTDSAGSSFDLSVNLAPVVLKNPTTLNVVNNALLHHGLEPRRLGLELLESEVLGMEIQRSALQDLVDLGVGLAMDDLGSGYSNLQRLSSFPFSALKLDRGLLLNAVQKPLDTLSLMATLIQMGRDLGMNVVVEGLEDESLTEAAVILGAPLGQGFHLASPMPASEAQAWERSFTFTLHRSPIQTPLGALAYHWQFARLGTSPPADLAHCPITRFITSQGGSSDVLAWHAKLHSQQRLNSAASRLLIDWLIHLIQSGQVA